MPRRPARPVSWVYSPGVRSTWASPLYLTSRSSTTVRAGLLIPRARAAAAERRGRVVAGDVLGAAQQGGVDPQLGARKGFFPGEEVHELVAHQHVLPQRHRPVLVDDHGGVPADLHQPLAELLGVAHGGR